MRRLILTWTILLGWTGFALAQTLTTDAPIEQKGWEIFLKAFFPVIWTAAAPYFTRYVTMGLLKMVASVPQGYQVIISSVLGGLAGAVAGVVPGFPLGVESATNMGIASGATGQLLLAANPGKIAGEVGTPEAAAK